jgi:hypothetical protein
VISPGGSRYPFEGAVDRARLLDESKHAATGSARVDVDRPGHLVVEVEAPGRRILALTERFHDGWSATSDGKPLPMVRVEQDFLGCVVDGGTHRIELGFMPRSFVHGSIVSDLGLVLLAAGLVVMSCGSSQRRYRTTT